MSKGSIVRAARKTVSEKWPHVNPASACFYLSMAIIEASKRLEGIDLQLQAGTFHWKRVPDHLDDGVVNTHFGYVWETESTDAAWDYVLANGFLPEVHVWTADIRRQQIVDLSTGALPEACGWTTEEPWLTPRPPDFVWDHVKELPKDGRWEPLQTASLFVRELADAVRSEKILLDATGAACLVGGRRFAVGGYVHR